MSHAHHGHAPHVEVVHATSPLCSWSWGYESVMRRLQLVYGDQVDFTVGVAVPYTDRAKWLEDYGMTKEEAVAFNNETVDAGGVPMKRIGDWDALPDTCVPSALAVKAAGILHGPEAERRLTRALMYAAFVEGQDTAEEDVIGRVVKAQGLDVAALLKAVEGGDAEKALEEDSVRLGHGANFFSILVRDGHGTTVVLEQAYDPARVESAIDWLLPGAKKTPPTDVGAYVRSDGPVHAVEVARVFAMDEDAAKRHLDEGVKAGKYRAVDVKDVGRFYAPT